MSDKKRITFSSSDKKSKIVINTDGSIDFLSPEEKHLNEIQTKKLYDVLTEIYKTNIDWSKVPSNIISVV